MSYKDGMRFLALALCLSSAWPLASAWWANRQTTLRHGLVWLWLAWAAWLTAMAVDLLSFSPAVGWVSPALLSQYIALCMSGCAAIAVFGARKPGVGAWNFVIVGLLAINSVPLAEGTLRGFTMELSGLRLFSVEAPLAVGILNYLPTRQGAAAALLLAACGAVLVSSFADTLDPKWLDDLRYAGFVGIGAAPWLAFALLQQKKGTFFFSAPVYFASSSSVQKEECPLFPEFDSRWQAFRNRFGFVWGERLRQQFNRSAHHNGWQVVLRWDGIRATCGSNREQTEREELLETLTALMKRFTTRGD